MTIEWTAPGQELDVGIGISLLPAMMSITISLIDFHWYVVAKEYQIKYSNVFDHLIDNNFNSNLPLQFGSQDVKDGSLQPLASGSKQRVTLGLPQASKNTTFYIALRAVNDNNEASNTSNIVSVKIVAIQQPPTEPPTAVTSTTTESLETSTRINNTSSTSITNNSTTPTTTWSPGTAGILITTISLNFDKWQFF